MDNIIHDTGSHGIGSAQGWVWHGQFQCRTRKVFGGCNDSQFLVFLDEFQIVHWKLALSNTVLSFSFFLLAFLFGLFLSLLFFECGNLCLGEGLLHGCRLLHGSCHRCSLGRCRSLALFEVGCRLFLFFGLEPDRIDLEGGFDFDKTLGFHSQLEGEIHFLFEFGGVHGRVVVHDPLLDGGRRRSGAVFQSDNGIVDDLGVGNRNRFPLSLGGRSLLGG
mmetsp:Transcript_12078/g.30592  ORF Transcript_12078/g.30592 Transcript_12078/m.30592 type:complete len:219 (+) Transcript_12078:3017-3673(+)